MPTPIVRITPYFYLASDATKAHVDPRAQPAGTALIYVSPFGRESPFFTTTPITNDPATILAAIAAKIAGGH